MNFAQELQLECRPKGRRCETAFVCEAICRDRENLQNALTPNEVLANFHDGKIFRLSNAEAPVAGTIHGICRKEDFSHQGRRKTSREAIELRVGAA